ncbi:hypothetical protein ACQP1K_26980 [Sphaerimonospora sp. CA-214678]|uniref:hypothetical protein n=1 Tax=Sphaerimonospora sp. CA-214678 TaxID=3240029 RepID=UPI003D91D9F0
MTIALALALAALGPTACGEDKQADARPLVLKEQVSSIAKSGAGYVVSWAGVLTNANRWHFGENATATITAVDAAGKEVVHMRQPLDAVPPGRSVAFSGQTTVSGQPVRVKIECGQATWSRIPRIPSAFLPFPISDVVTERLHEGGYLITGYVLDPFLKAASGVAVTALLRDPAGKLAGGGTAYLDKVQSNLKRRFVITVDGVTGGTIAKTDVLARTWGTTAKPYIDLALAGAAPIHTVAPSTQPFAKDRGYQVLADRPQ